MIDAAIDRSRRVETKPEKLLMIDVNRSLELSGWLVVRHHGLSNRASIADLQAIREGRVVMLELKAGSDIQSLSQKVFERTWVGHGGEYRIVRSLDDIEDLT
jgi:hypothetical protein